MITVSPIPSAVFLAASIIASVPSSSSDESESDEEDDEELSESSSSLSPKTFVLYCGDYIKLYLKSLF